MAKKSTNQLIEDLAVSVKRGFDGMHEEFTVVNGRLDAVENRLSKIENGHVGRIERLEDDMTRVKMKLGIR